MENPIKKGEQAANIAFESRVGWLELRYVFSSSGLALNILDVSAGRELSWGESIHVSTEEMDAAPELSSSSLR